VLVLVQELEVLVLVVRTTTGTSHPSSSNNGGFSYFWRWIQSWLLGMTIVGTDLHRCG